MSRAGSFGEVLDAVEILPIDEHAEWIGIVRCRVAERGRQRVIEEARQGRQENEAGLSQPLPIDDSLSNATSVVGWQLEELEKRQARHASDPASGLSWEEVQRKIRAKRDR